MNHQGLSYKPEFDYIRFPDLFLGEGDRTSGGPHPNPPLGKVREPDVKNLLL